jgi:hypothetical protein
MLGYSSTKGYVQLWAYGNTEREATNEWPLRWCNTAIHAWPCQAEYGKQLSSCARIMELFEILETGGKTVAIPEVAWDRGLVRIGDVWRSWDDYLDQDQLVFTASVLDNAMRKRKNPHEWDAPRPKRLKVS